MDEKARKKLQNAQLGWLTSLAAAEAPAGAVVKHVEALALAQYKYIDDVATTLRSYFPQFWKRSGLTPRQIGKLFAGIAMHSDPERRLDHAFEALSRYVKADRATNKDAWRDLLQVERGIAKARLSPPTRTTERAIVARLKSIKLTHERGSSPWRRAHHRRRGRAA